MNIMIVGLGNPEPEYNHTRHNVGFDTLDQMAGDAKWLDGGGYLYTKTKPNVILVKPTTGMNSSGLPVRKAMVVHGVSVENVILIYDDMDFDPGQIKIKLSGGDGKHNGVKSLISNVGADFTRVRVGIGKPKHKGDGLNFVLGTFPKHQRKLINVAIDDAIAATNTIINEGAHSAMAFFNQKKV